MIIFQPYEIKIKSYKKESILEIAGKAGIRINAVCGGRGLCGKCRVIIREGEVNLSKPTKAEKRALSEEDLKCGFRLACQARIEGTGTVIVEIPPESQANKQKLLVKGVEMHVKPKPAVKKIFVRLEKPSLQDNTADVDRLLEAIRSQTGLKVNVDYEVMKKIPHTLRMSNWRVSVVVWKDREMISIEQDSSPDMYGLAVDIGTTKMAGYIVDLRSGKVVGATSIVNPQIVYGEDVVSRIKFSEEGKLEVLRKCVINGINEMIGRICKDTNIPHERIYDMAVAGNTVMQHIFLGITPKYIAQAPYPAALQSSIDVKAREIGVEINPSAYVHVLPTIAGFVGGDTIADILATKIHEAEDVSMLIDIGTNTEIVLGDKKGLIACSCASGPAFEGSHIKCGMRALAGAIEHVWIEPGTFEVGYETIDDDKPRGLCGSAIVDVVAEMLKVGLIDSSGRFITENETPRLRRNGEKVEFVIAWRDEASSAHDIVITQNDIREVQLAKAAIYAGTSILMRFLKIQPNDIQRMYLAGAFGNYIDPQNAKIIGMYPDLPLERVRFVGNVAGSGVRAALLSIDAREKAANLARKIKYVELAADPAFQSEFLKATYLPHKELWRFPNVTAMLNRTLR